jgi:molybdopterin-synthase adenylyltransferase
MSLSAAIDTDSFNQLERHLLREDGQEDVCFAIWHTSAGAHRTTAIVSQPILPQQGERHVHGNASFQSNYLHRAAAIAAEHGGGLALLHSHPGGHGWQDMSADDIAAEQGHAARVLALTGRELFGLTIAGDGSLSARRWRKAAARTYEREDCESVRVTGEQLRLTFNPALRPARRSAATQARTVSAWGQPLQDDIARLRVAIIGTGSVGALIAELLARTGVGELVLIDFDSVEEVNLDRLILSSRSDVKLARSKVETLARALPRSATNPEFKLTPLELSIVEPDGFAAALDCDAVFCCVDRPWPRHVLNVLAYAHCIPVIDGGIAIRARSGRLRHAQWRAHTAAPGRRCMRCVGQYDLGLVDLERSGHLDDPRYMQGLPEDHVARRGENVIVFSAAVASLEILQLLHALIAPSGLANPGAQTYHFVGGRLDVDTRGCELDCPFAGRLLGTGDDAGDGMLGEHPAAERARAERDARRRRPLTRLRRWGAARSL